MNNKEIQALIALLDDSDQEVLEHVEGKIMSYGDTIIPFLEQEWETNFNPEVQKRIEDLIHSLQFESLKFRLTEWRDSTTHDLLEGIWLVATYQYPDLSLDTLKKQLEQIYYEVWLEFKPEAHAYDQIKLLNSVIFGKLKFRSNTKNFHAPGNSMINAVLESRKGNPISLCVVYMLVAQKLNLPVYGVNLPSLFILTYKAKEHQFYINAFNRGLIFAKHDIDNYIQQLKMQPIDMFYQPCSHQDIIRRVLRNLSASFEKLKDFDKANEVDVLLQILAEGDIGIQ